jgi:hypothetical protein
MRDSIVMYDIWLLFILAFGLKKQNTSSRLFMIRDKF